MFQAIVLNEIFKMNKMTIGKWAQAQTWLNILRRVKDLIWTPAQHYTKAKALVIAIRTIAIAIAIVAKNTI